MVIDCILDIDKNELFVKESVNINVLGFFKPTFYDQPKFHEYHQKFSDEVFRLIIQSNNKFIGYCYLGGKNGVLTAPYSSPFALLYLKENFKIRDACVFIDGIKSFAVHKDFKIINFTLPPEMYENELINTLVAAFFSQGFKAKSIELNNYFDLDKIVDMETYLKRSTHKVRKNYKNALKNELVFKQIEIEDFEKAYDVIKINREQMGYPLKISKQQMQDLINMETLVVRAFIIEKQEKPIAAALIFDVTEEISQVVYWGDILEYRAERAMDLLTSNIFIFYKKLKKKYLDIGPSSEYGIINEGLADFKKSIGCNTNVKITFEYTI